MCGIYLTNQSINIDNVKSKLETIKFRGPDYTGIFQKDNIIFGHLRLSIIDLDQRSNQPMTDDEYTIVYNGEIYNFQDIKKELLSKGYVFNTEGDCEVLLKGYKEWGQEIVSKINGMFAFAIYNSKSKKIFCARDRLGVKPFYYFWKDGRFEICSQLRPISKNRQINEEAISIYLDCTYIPSPHTIYKDVYKLSPGSILEIDLNNNTMNRFKFWDLKKTDFLKLSYKEAKKQVHELLKDAIKIRLQSDVPFGTFLSGGIDSALITSIASKISNKKIKTFSIGFENPKYDESKVASKYSRILDTQHTETICTPNDILDLIPKLVKVYDEPFADSSALPSLLLNKVTKKHVTMALSGDGGDESFLGYNNFDWVNKFTMISKVPYFIRLIISKFLIKNILGRRTQNIRRLLKLKTNDDFIKGIFAGYNSILKNRKLDWLSMYDDCFSWSKNEYQKTADFNIKLWLENDSNVKVDRASMASSIEVRSPFLDYRIIELARSLPISFRYMKGRKKRILRDILKEYIPESVFNQPKKGFSVPIGEWIRNELREEFVSNLSDDFLTKVPNLDIHKFKMMFRDHLNRKHDYSSYIWRVYVLSKWYQEFGFYNRRN